VGQLRADEDDHASLDNRDVRPDGEVRSVHGSVDAVLDAAGNVARLVGTIQDVSARKDSEEQFKRLLEAAPDAMVIVDRAGMVVLVNSQAEQLFGYSRAELIGQSVERLIPARFSGHAAQQASFSASSGARRMGAKRALFATRKDGSRAAGRDQPEPADSGWRGGRQRDSRCQRGQAGRGGTAPGQGRGRSRQRREERVSGNDESRDPTP
jgi:protein-histidine pros-kinase